MASKSINVTIDEKLLALSDSLVVEGKYANRSQFVQASIQAMLLKLDAEHIAEQAKLLKKNNDTEEWFEEELGSWQEEY
jgi:Arc/MetJ-type ribon-helix-helix transcriptional regulator